MGIRVRAASLDALLPPAIAGLSAAIGEFASAGSPKTVDIDILGDDPAGMFRDFLAEILDLFERDRRFVTAIDAVAFTTSALTATAQTELVDLERSTLRREVKAITYHELAIREVDGGYEATVIIDI